MTRCRAAALVLAALGRTPSVPGSLLDSGPAARAAPQAREGCRRLAWAWAGCRRGRGCTRGSAAPAGRLALGCRQGMPGRLVLGCMLGTRDRVLLGCMLGTRGRVLPGCRQGTMVAAGRAPPGCRRGTRGALSTLLGPGCTPLLLPRFRSPSGAAAPGAALRAALAAWPAHGWRPSRWRAPRRTATPGKLPAPRRACVRGRIDITTCLLASIRQLAAAEGQKQLLVFRACLFCRALHHGSTRSGRLKRFAGAASRACWSGAWSSRPCVIVQALLPQTAVT